jgi:hypothetical protein
MGERRELLADPQDRRTDPQRWGRLVAFQAFFTVVAVVCLAVEWWQRNETSWLIATAIALLFLSLALNVGRYFTRPR